MSNITTVTEHRWHDDCSSRIQLTIFRFRINHPQTKHMINDKYSIVGFNVSFDTIFVISATILRVTWPNQQALQHWRTTASQPGQGTIPPRSAFKNIYHIMKTEDTEALVRSKPNPVDRPVRTARTIVHHYNGTQYCSTETILLILPFLQTNIVSQMWPGGGIGI